MPTMPWPTFETTLNGPPYSGYPQFSAPDALAADIKDTGFDLVTTANNHSMDKGYDGLVRTLDTMDAAYWPTGSYRTQEEWNANHGVVVADGRHLGGFPGVHLWHQRHCHSRGPGLFA